MPTHDYDIANGTGAQVRGDINDALQAIVHNNSNSTEPGTTFSYMWWVDVDADPANNLLKIRNSDNTGWITVGSPSSANLGLASLASPSFTGTVNFAGDVNLNSTGYLKLPEGANDDRPSDGGTPANLAGYLRFNTDSNSFEGHNGTAWGSIGGGATGGGGDAIFYENGQTVNTDYELTASTNAMSAGPITIGASATVTIPANQTWVIV